MDAHNQKIDVISVCNADGSLSPLRFRYEDAEHHIQKVTVTEVLCCKPIQYVGIEAFLYTCRAIDGNRERMYELKYTVRSHCWVLFRVIC